MNSHIKALGAFYPVWGGMGIIAGVIVLAIFVIGGGLMAVEDPEAGLVFGTIGIILIVIIAILSVPNIIAGWALIKHRSWGRILTIILSILHLFAFRLGTALGIHGLWVMFQPEAIQIMEGRRPDHNATSSTVSNAQRAAPVGLRLTASRHRCCKPARRYCR